MYLSKGKLVYFLGFISLALPPIFLAVTLYKPILSVFPKNPELEVHFYLLTLFVVFILFFSAYILSFSKSLLGWTMSLKGKTDIGYLLNFAIISLISYLIFFFYKTYPYLSKFTTDFRDIGVYVNGDLNISLLIFSFVINVIVFLIISKSYFLKMNKTFYLFSFLVIIWLSFSIKNLNDYDFAYFAGPINDVLHGKFLLHNVPSQYGFLSIVFLSLIFKVIPFSLMNLTIVNAVIVTLGFILIFILLQFLYRNKLLSLFTMIFMIFLNLTIQILPEITFLQTSFIRFGMWVVLALCLALKIFNVLPLVALVITFFWNLDNGLYALFAYLGFLTIENLNSSFVKSIKKILPQFLIVLASLSAGGLLIELLYRIFFGFGPDWKIYLFDPFYYLGGFSMFPWPSSKWPWIIVSGYLVALGYIFVQKRFNNGLLNKRERLMSFILLYGIFQFVYFVGESHLNNLHHISIPFIIVFFYLIDIFLRNFGKAKNIQYDLKAILVISLMLTIPTFLILWQGTKNILKYNFSTSLVRIKEKDQLESVFLNNLLGKDTIGLIESKYGKYLSDNGITLISANDTWFLIKLGMVNNLKDHNFHSFTNRGQYQEIADEIIQKGDEYIFIDTKMKTPRTDSILIVYNLISNKYEIIETIGTLSVAKKINYPQSF